MMQVVHTSRFDRDLRRVKKRGLALEKLIHIVDLLRTQTPLPERNRDHKLIGNYAGCRECHIQPDWLLVYRIEGKNLILERTGSHADLFQ